MSVQWHYDIEDIPELAGDFDGATAAHAKAVLAIDYWKNEIKYYSHWTSNYSDGKKALDKWKALQVKAAAIIATFQLKLF